MYLWEYICVFQCSVSCGTGYQQRMVSCTAVTSAPNLQVFGAQSYTQVLPSKCPQPPPPNTQPCQLPVCLLSMYWKAGPWSKVCECLICVFNHAFLHSFIAVQRSLDFVKVCLNGHTLSMVISQSRFFFLLCFLQCSQTCGAGVMQRTVECLTDKRLPSKNCSLSSRPHSQAACRQSLCQYYFKYIGRVHLE